LLDQLDATIMIYR